MEEYVVVIKTPDFWMRWRAWAGLGRGVTFGLKGLAMQLRRRTD